MRVVGWAVLAALAATPARADPVVLELFTSQACSSCPPADALLARLAQEPGVIALDLHVDYWNRIGWRDPFGSADISARQSRYATLLGQEGVYTPELVVDGRQGVVGSDPAAVAAAIAAAEARPHVGLRVRRTADGVIVASDRPVTRAATLMLAGFDARHTTRIGGGENGGRTLTEADVVRLLVPVGDWSAGGVRFAADRLAGERQAVFLQAADGAILGAALVPDR